MRTTIDLPAELLRRAKATAALQGIKFKDLIAAFVERGLDASAARRDARGHQRSLPDFVPLMGQPIRSLTNVEIEEILLGEELESSGNN